MAEEISSYDDWKLKNSREIEVIVGECEHCGTEIYLNEEYYRTKVGKVHEECLKGLVESILEQELVSGLEGLLDY